MQDSSEIQHLSLQDMLNRLGQSSDSNEFYVHYMEDLLTENPFPFPFRSDNICIMIILQGSFQIQINLTTYTLGKGQVVVFPDKSVIRVVEVREGIKSMGLIFTESFAKKNIMKYDEINIFRFFSIKESPVWSPSITQVGVLVDLVTKLHRLSNGHEKYYVAERIHHYFNVLSFELMVNFKENVKEIEPKSSRKKELTFAFLNLLTLHAQQQRSVQFYADKLFVTPTYLSRVLKEVSGATTREIIEDAVIMEARDLLTNTSLSLAQIADKLNFSDPSFFGKYFKNKMQMSPKAFRKQYQ